MMSIILFYALRNILLVNYGDSSMVVGSQPQEPWVRISVIAGSICDSELLNSILAQKQN